MLDILRSDFLTVYCSSNHFLQCGSELIGCLWLMEISNPFMHMRELLKELGYAGSSLSLINDVSIKLVYLVYSLREHCMTMQHEC